MLDCAESLIDLMPQKLGKSFSVKKIFFGVEASSAEKIITDIISRAS